MARKHLSPVGVPLYNKGVGRFGLASCDDPAWKYRNLRRESTDGNETAEPQESCGQCSKFARWCDGDDRGAARYRRDESGGPPPTDTGNNPSRSYSRDSTIPGNASQRPGGAFGESRGSADSATPADQNPAVRTLPVLAPIASAGALLNQFRAAGGNAPTWPGYALSANPRSFAGGVQ